MRLTFSGVLPAGALDFARYSVTDAAGARLALLFAEADGENSVLLATAQQSEVRYRVSFADAAEPEPEPDATAEADGVGGTAQGLWSLVEFSGSVFGETYVASATAISNTQVIVSFSDGIQVGGNIASSYSIQLPNLTVLSAEVSRSGDTVLLTTSPQEAIGYTLRVKPVGVASGKQQLLDPTRSGSMAA